MKEKEFVYEIPIEGRVRLFKSIESLLKAMPVDVKALKIFYAASEEFPDAMREITVRVIEVE